MWKLAYYYECDTQLIATTNINTSSISGSVMSTLLFYSSELFINPHSNPLR